MDIRIHQRGFTLIEILVAAVIMVILGAGFLGLQYIYSQNQLVAWKNYLSIEDANSTMTTLARELRNARDADNGDYLLEVASDQEIIFYSDTNSDGNVEKVRYTLTGTEFVKGTIEPTGDPVSYPLADEKVKVLTEIVRNESSPVFFYYNKDWPTDTTNNPLVPSDRIAETRVVKFILRSNTEAGEPDSDYVLESDVQIRMLREI